LKELGYTPGPIDGVWGKKTEAALKKFQQKQGLIVSGRLNEQTQVKLGLKQAKIAPEKEQLGLKKPRTTLRSLPKTLAKEEIVNMIREQSFNHPEDYSAVGLSGRATGGFQHQYETKTFYGEKIVLDHSTGLIWQQNPTAFVPGNDIRKHLKQVNANRYAGFSDWRLPTIEELASLLEHPGKGRDFLHPAFAMPYWYCVSADTVKGDASSVWVVFFEDGYVIHHDASDDFDILLVRSGQ
jgi:peptidoglycan hydrolase-like protein with peptidoglycan-binding domain